MSVQFSDDRYFKTASPLIFAEKSFRKDSNIHNE